jgi:hypothetical protein
VYVCVCIIPGSLIERRGGEGRWGMMGGRERAGEQARAEQSNENGHERLSLWGHELRN